MSKLIKFNKDNTFQRLRAHYISPDENPISEKEKEQLTRALLLFTLRTRNKFSRQQSIKKVIDQFDVSQATAYRDYQMMSAIFGELNEIDSRVEKVFVREEYWFLYQQLRNERDFVNAAKVLKLYDNTLPPVADENELDKDKIAAHEYHIKIDRDMANAMKSHLTANGVIDLNSIDVTDVDYKILEEDEEDSSS